MVLASLQIVTQEEIKDLRRAGGVLRHHPDQPPGLRIHGGQPHHIRLVLAKALGAVDLVLLALQLFDDVVFLLVGVGKPGLAAAVDLKEGSLGDVDVPLPDQGGRQAVEHGQHQGTDLEAVHIAIGTDDHLVPPEVIQVEGRHVLDVLVLDLHAAAQDLDEVRDDVAFENTGVVRLQAVEDLAPDGHDALVLCVPGLLDAAQSAVALHDVDLPLVHVLGAAVHEFLYPVGDVDGAGELLLDVQTGLLRLFPAALVEQDLLADLLGVKGIFDKVDLQVAAEEFRHGLLDKLVGDGLFGLVFVAGLGGKVVAHQDQAVLHVGPGDLALAFLVLALVPKVFVDGGDKGGLGGLFRAAAVLQPAGVVVVLDDVHPVGKAHGHAELDLVLRLVRPVPALLLRLPEHGGGKGPLAGKLLDIVHDAVFIEEVRLLKLAQRRLAAEAEGDALVHHRLALHDVGKVLRRDGDVGEHIQVRQPAGAGAGLFLLAFGERRLGQLTHQFAPLEVEAVLKAVPPDGHVHVAGGILGGAGAQTVEAQGVLIVVAGGVVILATGVKLAVHQLPVIALLLFVPVHRAAPARVLHLDGAVRKAGEGDDPAVALPGLVDGVGEDLKDCVLAAVQSVGAENNAGPLAHPVCSF